MKKIFVYILLSLIINKAISQELKCAVQVNATQIAGTNNEIFEELQKSIYQFMNTYKWTNDVFSNEERIECTVIINLNEKISGNEFKGTIQVQATRPVYNASYKTQTFNYLDKDFTFKYNAFQQIEFTINSHTSNLASVLAFYAYMILGSDYDSFSLEGGTKYYQKAQTIVQNAANAPEPGWKAFESYKNRYWMVENILNQTFKPMRKCWYEYHRLGLDIMANQTEKGRAIIAESLMQLEQVHQQKPASFNMTLFFNAKADEIVNIFSESFPSEKKQVYNLLTKINPGNTTKYDKILQSK
ncbi:MAG: DUF4835 family protein [Vicingaceae bacterium]